MSRKNSFPCTILCVILCLGIPHSGIASPCGQKLFMASTFHYFSIIKAGASVQEAAGAAADAVPIPEEEEAVRAAAGRI